MKALLAATSAAALICAAAPAMAAPLGVSNGYADLGWSLTQTQGASPSAITGRAGARIMSWLGVEGELGYGISTGTRTFAAGTPGAVDVDVKQKLGGAGYLVGYAPITPNFDLLAKVGYGATNYSINPAGGADYHVHTHGVRYGAGGEYYLDGKNGVRVDYTRERLNGDDSGGYFSSDKNASVWTVAYAHRF